MGTTPLTARPGRPRAFDDDQVLDTALEMFWRDGYGVTSTRDLEARLGVSQSSLYNAFGSKADLLAAAMDRYEARIDDALVAPLEHAGTGLESIVDFFGSLRRWIAHEGKRGCMVINLMAEDGGRDDALTRRTARYRRRVRTALRGALERAVVHGELTEDHLDERTDLLLGMVLGMNIAVRGGAGPAEVNRLLRAVTRQVAAWRPDDAS